MAQSRPAPGTGSAPTRWRLPLTSYRNCCCCRIARVARGLPELGSGMVVGVPIPADQAADAAPTQAAIATALAEADAKRVGGSEITPFLLERVRQLTGGRSLEANIRLIKHNAAVGASIAVELARLRHSS